MRVEFSEYCNNAAKPPPQPGRRLYKLSWAGGHLIVIPTEQETSATAQGFPLAPKGEAPRSGDEGYNSHLIILCAERAQAAVKAYPSFVLSFGYASDNPPSPIKVGKA